MLFEETELGTLERYANESTNGAIRYLFANINASTLKRVLNSKKADKDGNKVGIEYQCKLPTGDFEPAKKDLTYKGLKALYASCKEFGEKFASFEIFTQVLYKLATDNAKTRTNIRVINNNNNSIANQVASSGQAEEGVLSQIPNFVPIPLNTNFSAVCYQPSEQDKWYFDRMCQDENGQLYWRFKTPIDDCGCIYPISIKSDKDGKKIDDDDKFWEHFFEEESETLRQYCIEVDKYIKNFYAGVTNPDYFESDLPAFEAGLRSICPSVLINSFIIGFLVKKTKDHTVIDIGLRLKSGDSFDRISYQKVLACTLIKSIPLSKLKVIKIFDDVASNAVHKLPTRPYIDKIPTKHPDLLEYNCKSWHNFLRSEGCEGQTKFPSQRMGEFRLAKAIVSMCEKDDFSRQILSLAGEGDDGKTVFIDAIREILGENLVSPGKSQNDLTSSFGMQNMINKRVVVFDDITDPYKFFNNEIVKQISGAGKSPIEIQRKFLSSWAWRPSGCKIIMSANKPYSLYDEATITRCLPLTFLKNYKLRNVIASDDLKSSLVLEGNNFIKWCYAVCLYYNNVKNCKGEKCPLFKGAGDSQYSFIGKNVIICSDEQFDAWMNGTLDLAPDNISIFRSQRNDAFTTESQIPHKANSFITLKQEDSEECEVNDYFNELCECIFIKDENKDEDEKNISYLTSADFGLRMMDYICMVEREIRGNAILQKIYRLIRASGFSSFKSIKELTASKLWINFKQYICDKYNVEFKSNWVKDENGKNGKNVKSVKGLKMLSYDYLFDQDGIESTFNLQLDEQQTDDPTC